MNNFMPITDNNNYILQINKDILKLVTNETSDITISILKSSFGVEDEYKL